MTSGPNPKRFGQAAIIAGMIACLLFYHFQTKTDSGSLKNLATGFVTRPDPKSSPHPNWRQGPAQEKLRLLEQVLASRNDNDPRLDQELRFLDDPSKQLFREKYQTIAPEKRNDRGTIAFLLGRNLTQAKDFEFFKSVVSEPACLSLKDCSKAETGEDHAGGLAITLAYPQLVAIQSMGAYIKGGGPWRSEAASVLTSATNSTVPAVSKMAKATLGRQ